MPTRSICAALGVDIRAQSDRLREHDVLAQVPRVVTVPLRGRVQAVLGISRRFLAFWLATITPSEVRESAQPKLILAQVSENAHVGAGRQPAHLGILTCS